MKNMLLQTTLRTVSLLWCAALLMGIAAAGCRTSAQTPERSKNSKTRAAAKESSSWPQFRGPNAAGVSSERNLPVEFGPGTNVIWRMPLPPGHSSPCVWGDRIFLTAREDSKRLVVLCVRRDDGQLRWKQEVPAERIENVHPRVGSPASSTPATDGQQVYVFFGSVGLVCFDFEGRQAWKHELGPFAYHLGWGAASSPIVYGDSVILNCDHDGESFLLALHKTTGRMKWRTARPNAPPSYSTPILWTVSGQTQLIVAGSGSVTAYYAETGKELWHVSLPNAFVATTPTLGNGLLFVAAVDSHTATGNFNTAVKANRTPNWDNLFANHDGNRDGKLSPDEVPMMSKERFDGIDTNHDGFLTREELTADARRPQQGEPPPRSPRAGTGNVLLAIRPGGQGDVTETNVTWRAPRVAPYVPSPLCYGEYLYVVKGGGIVSCFAAATGNQLWQERPGGGGDYYASPVAAAGKVYFVSEAGEVTVLAAGPKLQVLTRNALGERCLATPAIAAGRLYVRTETHLYCFGSK